MKLLSKETFKPLISLWPWPLCHKREIWLVLAPIAITCANLTQNHQSMAKLWGTKKKIDQIFYDLAARSQIGGES